jgi:hypothetical protein
LVAAQDQRDSPANRSKIIAFENAWNQAEERKDARALDALIDNWLVYTDYDGTLKTKADFLASVKAAGRRPEPQVRKSMKAHVYGDTAVVTGVYRLKGVDRASHTSAGAASLIRGVIRTGQGCA